MTATEILRRMLDERGVEWIPSAFDPQYETFYESNGVGFIVTEFPEIQRMSLACDMRITPEQAIAATLGSCNCSNNCTDGERTGTCKVEWRENGWGTRTRHCGKCGADLDCDTRNRQNYCPNCGAKIVEPTTNNADAEVDA